MLEVNNISFSYANTKTIDAVSFSVEKGQNIALIGESGCGKSTLLKLIYGLYDLNEGHIFWNNNEVLGPKFNLIPGIEEMKYLAQDFDLMPFISVSENIGKYLSNFYPEEKKQRIAQLLEVVEMQGFANTKAKYLSGGQMQRVALARVLAVEPEVLLLDEPFSHIDNFKKNSLRRNLFEYLKEKKITTIIASHDKEDYLPFADRLLVLENGKIIANDSPKSLYKNPKKYAIASLFEDINEIPASYLFENASPSNLLFIYPHQLQIVPESLLEVTVSKSYFKGNHYLIEAKYQEGLLYFIHQTEIDINTKLFLKIKL